jgi:hypothetical protein
VFALFSERLVLVALFLTPTRMDSGWSAMFRYFISLGGFSPAFPKIGRLTAPVGYICWDFLFNVAGGSNGWTIRQGLSTTLRISLVLLSKVDAGYSQSSWLDCDRVVWRYLGYRRDCLATSHGTDENNNKKKLLCSQHRA